MPESLGESVTCCLLSFEPGLLIFSFCSVALISLGFMSVPCFPPLISCQWFPHSRAGVMCNIWWCYPCIIGVCHPGLHVLYKSIGNYCLGLLFPKTQWGRGLGLDLDWIGSRSNSNSGFGEWAPSHSSLWISHILVTMICTLCVKYYFLCLS